MVVQKTASINGARYTDQRRTPDAIVKASTLPTAPVPERTPQPALAVHRPPVL